VPSPPRAQPSAPAPNLAGPALADEAHALLAQLTGIPGATFRDSQLDAIVAAVTPHQRTLLVQRTGWGKSAVYFIATRLRRDRGAGPTLLVSPLLALMRNQIEAASRMGINAVTINSTNTAEWSSIIDRVRADEVDLLVISPERLANAEFRTQVLHEISSRAGLLVVDEAHCISDWGHDFRPDYRRIVRVLDLLASETPVLCCTATANDRVVEDVVAQLGADPGHPIAVLRGPLGRPGLALQVITVGEGTQAERLAWLATVIPSIPGAGIIYCLTVADTNRVAGFLRAHGIDALAYSGQAETETRIAAEDALLANEIKVLVATSALGMGFDKPDLAFVIHFQSPGSPVAYYQQVGRAGRRLDESVGVLLPGVEDAQIQDWFIDTAFPPQPVAEAVVKFLERHDPRPQSVAKIEAAVNISRGRLSTMLKVLEVDNAIVSVKGGYTRTKHEWAYDLDRVEQVTANRRAEQAELGRYAALPEGACRMAFLRNLLDDNEPGAGEPCGRCDCCTGRLPALAVEVAPALVGEALAFLRASPLVLEPRRQWPSGLDDRKGRIGDGAVEEGRALSRYADGGWGRLVADAVEGGTLPSPEVLDAAAALIIEWRGLDPTRRGKGWVTAVPSQRRVLVGGEEVDPVQAIGEALAERIGRRFHPLVRLSLAHRPQAEMANSAQQAANLVGVFTLDPSAAGLAAVPDGPCILVDDVAASRWTLTTVGAALRAAGSGPVLPFVLASTVG